MNRTPHTMIPMATASATNPAARTESGSLSRETRRRATPKQKKTMAAPALAPIRKAMAMPVFRSASSIVAAQHDLIGGHCTHEHPDRR